MSREAFSIIVQCRRDAQGNFTRLQVVNVDTAEEVLLSDSSFLLRCWTENATVERCLIRHLSSGREIYVQSGPGLRAFIGVCLLNDNGEEPSAPRD